MFAMFTKPRASFFNNKVPNTNYNHFKTYSASNNNIQNSLKNMLKNESKKIFWSRTDDPDYPFKTKLNLNNQYYDLKARLGDFPNEPVYIVELDNKDEGEPIVIMEALEFPINWTKEILPDPGISLIISPSSKY